MNPLYPQSPCPKLSNVKKACIRHSDETERFWNKLYTNGNLMIHNAVTILSSHPIELKQIEEASLIMLKRHVILRSTLTKAHDSSQIVWEEICDPNELKPSDLSELSITSESKDSTFWLRGIHQAQLKGFVQHPFLWRIHLFPSESAYKEIDSTKVCSYNQTSIELREETSTEDDDIDSCIKTTTKLHTHLSPSTTYENSSSSSSSSPSICISYNQNVHTHYRTCLIASFHHTVVDGISRASFWNDIISCLITIASRDIYRQKIDQLTGSHQPSNQCNHNHGPGLVLPDSAQIELPPPLSHLVGTSRDFLLSHFISRFGDYVYPTYALFSSIRRHTTNPFGFIFNPSVDPFSVQYPTTSIIPIRFDKDQTSEILDKCRKKNITINNLISSLTTLVMAELSYEAISDEKYVYAPKFPPSGCYYLHKYLPQDYINFLELVKHQRDSFEYPFYCQDSDRPIDSDKAVNRVCFSPVFEEDTTHSSYNDEHSIGFTFEDTSPEISHTSKSNLKHPSSVIGTHSIPDPSVGRDLKSSLKNPFLHVNTDTHPLGNPFTLTQTQSGLPFRKSESNLTNYEGLEKSQRKFRLNCVDTFLSRFLWLIRKWGLRDMWRKFLGLIFRIWIHNKRNLRLLLLRISGIKIETWQALNCRRWFSHDSSQDDKSGAFHDYLENVFLMGVNPTAEQSNTTSCGSMKKESCSDTSPKDPPKKSPNDKQLHNISKSSLGSYALLMTTQLKFPNKPVDENTIIETSHKVKQEVNSLLNKTLPRSVLLDWSIKTGYIANTKNNNNVLSIISTTPRRSAILISNAGRWDNTPIEILINLRDKFWKKKIHPSQPLVDPIELEYVKQEICFTAHLESSWMCVSQDKVGSNEFSHNVVTLENRLYWSFQYHTNFTHPNVALVYVARILHHLETFLNSS